MRAAVLGSPVSHSLSPALHRAAYAALGLRGWTYTAVHCDEARLPGFLDRLDQSWAGLSLTMPLKRAVLPLLDEVDPLASAVGGANTVVLRGDRRCGFNTDVGGMVDALAAAGVTTRARITKADALIIGAGATACSAVAALRELGVDKVAAVVRDIGRAGELVAAAGRLGVSVQLHDLRAVQGMAAGIRPSSPGPEPGQIGIAVCTIPPGSADPLVPWLCGRHRVPRVVFDVAYEPWPTLLAATASASGSTVVGGFELLLHQAGRQVKLMTGRRAPLAAMRRAGVAELIARASAE